MDTKKEDVQNNAQQEQQQEQQQETQNPNIMFIEGTIEKVNVNYGYGKILFEFGEGTKDFERINPETGEVLSGKAFTMNGAIQRNLPKVSTLAMDLSRVKGFVPKAFISLILTGAKVKVRREFKEKGSLRYDGTPASSDYYAFDFVNVKSLQPSTFAMQLAMSEMKEEEAEKKAKANLFNVE